jgi:ABC-type Fe3+/spermidine/putrescine transport system ATPase subunit
MDAFTEIRLEGVSYAFGSNTVLNQIDLLIPAGTIVALLGPSGCGKSTLLRLLAGLTQPADGTITFGSRLVAKAGWALPPESRDIGMVFQDYALWPHMTVEENIAFPLKMRNVPRAEREHRVLQALARVGLGEFAKRKPAGLSGGQQQRVALAGPLSPSRACCCLMNPFPISTASCANHCAVTWHHYCASSALPPFMSPMIVVKPRSSLTVLFICLPVV